MKNKKTVLAILSVIAVVLVIIGATYAYWLVTKTQNKENVISSACLDIEITGEKNDIKLTEQYPISDDEGKALTPYEFTVTNKCNQAIDYQVALEAIGTESAAVNAGAIKVALDDTVSILSSNKLVDTTVEGAYKSYRLKTGTLTATGTDGASATYKLRLWIDKDASIDEMNKTFTSKISVTIGQGIEKAPIDKFQQGTLAYSIISNYSDKNNIIDLNAETTDVSKVTKSGIFAAEDNDATSYYYRGDINNNYVKMGEAEPEYWFDGLRCDDLEYCNQLVSDYDALYPEEAPHSLELIPRNHYWRIVRINGDGTIRLVYDGVYATENGVDKNVAILKPGSDDINLISYDDSAEYLEDWYNEELLPDYSGYIASSKFCEDKEEDPSTYSYYDGDANPVGPNDDWVTRGYSTMAYARFSNNNATLKCKSDYVKTETIAHLTMDEVLLAGGLDSDVNSYIESTNSHWLMTLYEYNLLYNNFTYQKNYLTNSSNAYPDQGIRPVININNITNFKGNGTIDSPYEIVTE